MKQANTLQLMKPCNAQTLIHPTVVLLHGARVFPQ